MTTIKVSGAKAPDGCSTLSLLPNAVVSNQSSSGRAAKLRLSLIERVPRATSSTKRRANSRTAPRVAVPAAALSTVIMKHRACGPSTYFDAGREENSLLFLIAEIVGVWRTCKFWIAAHVTLTNRARSYCIRSIPNNLTDDMPEAARKSEWKRISKEADRMIKAILRGDPMQNMDVANAILPILGAREQLEKENINPKRRILKKLAKQLPAAAWVMSDPLARGFGLYSFAGIVAEAAGNDLHTLLDYANPGKLWTRFGRSVFEGKACSTWMREKDNKLTKEQWIKARYSPKRSALMRVIGVNLIKAKGPLKKLYDEEKAAYRARGWTKSHAHNAALRIIEKRLLRELWRAWREAHCALSPNEVVPPSNLSTPAGAIPAGAGAGQSCSVTQMLSVGTQPNNDARTAE